MPASAVYSYNFLEARIDDGGDPLAYFVPAGKRMVLTQVCVTFRGDAFSNWEIHSIHSGICLIKNAQLAPDTVTEIFEGRIVIPDDGAPDNGIEVINFGLAPIEFNLSGYLLSL